MCDEEIIVDIVDDIPHDGEWYNSSSRETFINLGKELAAKGWNSEDIEDFLESAYIAVSCEYGN